MASFSSAPKESAPAMTLRGEDAVAESAMMRLWEVESNGRVAIKFVLLPLHIIYE